MIDFIVIWAVLLWFAIRMCTAGKDEGGDQDVSE